MKKKAAQQPSTVLRRVSAETPGLRIAARGEMATEQHSGRGELGIVQMLPISLGKCPHRKHDLRPYCVLGPMLRT